MSLHHISSGEIFRVSPLGEGLKDQPSTALFKTENLEIIRLVLRKGKSLPEHAVSGEITVHCLEGKIELEAHGRKQVMQAGDLLYLEPMALHALHALEDASVLVTILLYQGSASPQDAPGAPAT